MAQSFRQCRGGEEWVFALAQVGVVEVQRDGEQIDGDGVGEGGFHEAVAGALVDGTLGTVGAAAIDGAATMFVGVLAGFAAHVGRRPATRRDRRNWWGTPTASTK